MELNVSISLAICSRSRKSSSGFVEIWAGAFPIPNVPIERVKNSQSAGFENSMRETLKNDIARSKARENSGPVERRHQNAI